VTDMFAVKNKKAVANLSRKTLAANWTRNLIAVIAIVLTSLLFTALFTIALTIIDSYEQSTFRQSGGDAHGTFKNITKEQTILLQNDPLVVQGGVRRFLGMPAEAPLHKAHIELSAMDPAYAKMVFCTPTTGHLPQEGSDEIACDTRILRLLGITPELGAKLTLPFSIGVGAESTTMITDTFTLCGWWEYDEATLASHALIPFSYIETVLAQYPVTDPNDLAGQYDLNLYLKSSLHIAEDLETILEKNGLQNQDSSLPGYVSTGINWAYTGAQVAENLDFNTLLCMGVLLLLVICTGYLIIYNIFRISVAGDIRFYGLLQTVGTTSRQLRSLVRRQALLLCVIGIPLGLLLGYAVGFFLAPVALSVTSIGRASFSTSPLIFLFSALFSLITVLLSCSRPSRIAGRVSPVEAVRYTEGTPRKSAGVRRSGNGGLVSMTLANLSRTKGKTVLVILSLALAVVLLQITYTFASGFDMDKYLSRQVISDFILGDAAYFSHFQSSTELSPDDLDAIEATGLLEEKAVVSYSYNAQCYVPESFFRASYEAWLDGEEMDDLVAQTPKDAQGRVEYQADLYGMDAEALDKLTVLEGSLDALNDPSQNVVAAVTSGRVPGGLYHPGDTVTVRHVDEYAYFDAETGRRLTSEELASHTVVAQPLRSHDVEYTVVACVSVPQPMSFRHYGGAQLVLGSERLAMDSCFAPHLLNCCFDVRDGDENAMEQFLTEYTNSISPSLNFESKQKYVKEFSGMQQTFVILGMSLSFVVGLVGVLNFLNAILTSIMARRRELAMLQAIGMTGRQLKGMLVLEGIAYALLAAGVSLLGSLAVGRLFQNAVGEIFSFFTYRFSLLPLAVITPLFLALGAALPLFAHRFAARSTIVERLRQTE